MDAEVASLPAHDAVEPEKLARMVERRGHRRRGFAEDTRIPAGRETPWGREEGSAAAAAQGRPHVRPVRRDRPVARGRVLAAARDGHLPRHGAHAGVHGGPLWLPSTRRAFVEERLEEVERAMTEHDGAD